MGRLLQMLRGKKAWVGIVLAATLVGCGSDSDPDDGGMDPVVRSMAAVAGDAQTADVGTDVAVPPSVGIVDDGGLPVAGVGVTFAVTAGGGSVAGGSKTTDQAGRATVDGWTLGPAAGTNTLTASADGVNGSPVTFTATAVVPPAALQYDGAWVGTWINTTFNSTGTTDLIVVSDAAAGTVSLTTSSTGAVLGVGGATAQERIVPFDETGLQLVSTMDIYGDVMLSLDANGALTISGTNVQEPGIDSWSASGTIGDTTLNLTFTVNFVGGGTAAGTITATKQ